MKNEIQDNQTTETINFPYGWNKGDICVLITNKAKKSTCEYIVESYDGKYFGVCILRVNRSVFTDKLITCHGDLDQ